MYNVKKARISPYNRSILGRQASPLKRKLIFTARAPFVAVFGCPRPKARPRLPVLWAFGGARGRRETVSIDQGEGVGALAAAGATAGAVAAGNPSFTPAAGVPAGASGALLGVCGAVGAAGGWSRVHDALTRRSDVSRPSSPT